jgi:hypothetical protein
MNRNPATQHHIPGDPNPHWSINAVHYEIVQHTQIQGVGGECSADITTGDICIVTAWLY